jgi:4-hydroxy-3-polyprenylbenzoate decarboxylase
MGGLQMSSEDLRSWLKLLKANGELVEIEEEVDWKFEMGCLIRRIFDISGGGPAVLFKNIKGYKNKTGRKFFAGSFSSYKRIAMAMGLAPQTPYQDIVSEYIKKTENYIPPIVVSQGPCKEVIHKDKDVDLLNFPVPHLNPFDGGRYMGTFHLVVTKDPETGIQNVGMYRMMVNDRNHLGALLIPIQHWGVHFAKYTSKRRKMPVAICFGPPQIVLLTAMAKFQHPPDEFAYAGGLAGEAIKLSKCETVDLEVPAESEIILEGLMDFDPSTFRFEGPFSEYMGYMAGKPTKRPVVEVRCITHREDPILQGTLEGRCVPGANEDHHCMSIVNAAYAYRLLKNYNIDVVGAFAPLGATGCNKVIIAIRQHRQGEAMQIASLLWGAFGFFKEVVIVDEDIDVCNPNMVEFAIATRVDPIDDIRIVDGFPGIPLDPRISPSEKESWMGGGRWSKVCIDATRPFTWPPQKSWGERKFPPVQHWPDEIENMVDSKWKKYGLGNYTLPPRWNNTY